LSFDRVPFREALRYPLILCHPDKCAGGYKLFQQMFKASGLPPPTIADYISGHEPMMLLVAAGYGVGFGLESQAALYNHPDIRGGSVCLNSFGRFAKWISASIMPPPSLVSAR
jgi:hypothetical protein